MKQKDMPQQQTKMPKQQKQLSYAEWMTGLFKKFSKEMEYIKKNTTDHERAQMSRANAVGTPNDKMTLRDIYDEMWKLDTKCNKEETIGTAHEKGENKVERMTEEDWERWDNNETQMKNERTGVYAQVTEQYTQEEYEQWRQLIRQPEKPIQTENAELREWIRVMFELPREDMCNWRQKHDRIEEFKEIPNNKNIEPSSIQIEKEIVKDVEVKQQKKMPGLTQEETKLDKPMRMLMEQLNKNQEKTEENFKKQEEKINEKLDQIREENKEYFRKQREERKETYEQHRKEMREIFRNNTEELCQKIDNRNKTTEEIPKGKNIEHSNQKTKETGKIYKKKSKEKSKSINTLYSKGQSVK